jgi:hypothetical protein
MNIPEIYLVEPYNAYAPKGKKKHWMQEVEEQALLARILAEQQQLQEAAVQRSSNTLPPQAPPTSQATYQNYSGGQGAAGQANSNGGGGQAPRPQFFNPDSGSYTFTISPNTSSAPSTVQASVVGGANTLALGGAQVGWTWGDGTTGGGAGASHTYSGTGSFAVTMVVTSTANGTLIGAQTQSVTMSVPTVASAFTLTGSTTVINNGYYTASVGDTITFINGASTNNPSNTLTYNWTFGSGSAPSSSLTNPTFTYSTASTYTVTLGVSGSFNAIATGTRAIKIV